VDFVQQKILATCGAPRGTNGFIGISDIELDLKQPEDTLFSLHETHASGGISD